MALMPFELVLQLAIFSLLSRIKKHSLAYIIFKGLIYLIPPRTEDIVHLETDPELLRSQLKAEGKVASTKGKSKDAIDLVTAELDGPIVAIDGEKLTQAAVLANAEAGRKSPSSSTSIKMSNALVVADMSSVWKHFVDLITSSLLSLLITYSTTQIVAIDYFHFSTKGFVSIIAALLIAPLYVLILVLWRRTSTSFDWKMSWIVAFAFMIGFFVVLGQTHDASANKQDQFWDIPIATGFKNMMSSYFDFAVSTGYMEYNPITAKKNLQKPTTVQERQVGLQRLFSENPEHFETADSDNWWGDLYTYSYGSTYTYFKIALILIAFPIGLILFISVNRQVKGLAQSRKNHRIPSSFRTLNFINTLILPGVVLIIWCFPVLQWLESVGGIPSTERVSRVRRIVCILYALQQLVTIRSMAQAHLEIGELITRIILSASKKTSNKGLTIQMHLRNIVKSVYVVAIELSALPVLCIGLLACQFWLCDALYLAIVLASWPITWIAFIVPDQELRAAS